ncbi:hypothetical protein NDU88_006860 [Pleurodeles waltl]|uniref:Uncharacterized protein n=1 Tax=Pleurodeles waltl TaxID=8319 RepID=A0AAV7UP23_PLEWA|nr:hypothetical protein NDU88_006860 [Pleurodeles waltl]
MIAGGTDIATALSWLCAARQPGGRSTARGTMYRLVRPAAARATLHFFCCLSALAPALELRRCSDGS